MGRKDVGGRDIERKEKETRGMEGHEKKGQVSEEYGGEGKRQRGVER